MVVRAKSLLARRAAEDFGAKVQGAQINLKMLFKPRTESYSDIEAYAKCPSCQHLIKQKSLADTYLEGSKICPFCHILIEKKQFIESCQIYLKTTRAIQAASEISAMRGGLFGIFILILITAAYRYLGAFGKYHVLFFLAILVSVLLLLGGFLNTQNWLSKFGSIHTADEEYIAVRKQVRQSHLIWVWAAIINLIWWIIYIKFL
jgi:hypothetical protein